MLDCSTAMILYGEDRSLPRRKFAMALSHLIARSIPATRFRLCCFMTLPKKCRCRSSPASKSGRINTKHARGPAPRAAYLAAAEERHEAIVMITDGKPSALTLEDGRIYKNALASILWSSARLWKRFRSASALACSSIRSCSRQIMVWCSRAESN